MHAPWKKIAYPAILVCFTGVTIGVFANSVAFIGTQIDLTLSRDAAGETSTLDMDRYNAVARRLGLSEISRDANHTPPIAPPTPATSTPALPPSIVPAGASTTVQ